MDEETENRSCRRGALYPVVRTDEVENLVLVTQSPTSVASMKSDEHTASSVLHGGKHVLESLPLSSSMMAGITRKELLLSSRDLDVDSVFQNGDFLLEQRRILNELSRHPNSHLSSPLQAPQEGYTSAVEMGNGQTSSLEVVNDNNVTGQAGTHHGNNTVTKDCGVEESFDIQSALNDHELIREQMRLLQELQKERSTAADPCPSSKHNTAAPDDSLALYEHDSLVHLPNGFTLLLQGTTQVYQAVENGTSIKVQCFQCQSLYLLAPDAQALYCMECHQVSSMALAIETIQMQRQGRRKQMENHC